MPNYDSSYTGEQVDQAVGRALPDGEIDSKIAERYKKPVTGIPESDLAEAIRNKLYTPVTKNYAMTQAVGVGQDKKLYTYPSGGGGSLPVVTTLDNGKILQVVNGVWTASNVLEDIENGSY